MAYPLGLHPGTVWHKSDFQCHTPRDHDWSGSPDLPGGGEAAETAREDWAKSFVKAAEDAGLLAVAISDHHDICLSKYVIAAAVETGSAVRVFPAVEITLADNAQCLAIFDPSLEADTQKLALAAAGNLLPATDADSKTCAIVPARETVMGFVRNIAAEQHLKDVSVILPHFSREDAHRRSTARLTIGAGGAGPLSQQATIGQLTGIAWVSMIVGLSLVSIRSKPCGRRYWQMKQGLSTRRPSLQQSG